MSNTFYQVGGSIPINAPCYVKRLADDQYYHCLLEGRLSYVLNARQTGKTSLKIQTMAKLKRDQIITVAIDLGLIGGQDLSAEKFYASFLGLLIKALNLPLMVGKWWRDHDHLSYLERLDYFFQSVILEQISQPIVIFIDEVDSLLNFENVGQEFLLFVFQCYQKRLSDPRYQRLTFSILGTGNFLDLVSCPENDPFVQGQHILLRNFTVNEAQPLLLGLKDVITNPEETLINILEWTGGQPFLTQKLCHLVVVNSQKEAMNHRGKKLIKKSWLNQLVRDKIIDQWEIQDDPTHLKNVRDRILNVKYLHPTLKLYQQILQGKKVKFALTREHIDLSLSGLAVHSTEFFDINNPIYQNIFNEQWLQEKLFGKTI